MNNLYEKTGLLSRIRESGTLIIFIIFSLLISLLVMNLLIFPVAVFSINNKAIFTQIVKYLLLVILSVSIIFALIKKILFYKKSGMTYLRIAKLVFLRPFSFLLFIIIVLLILFLLILLVNFVLNNNYYFLYKIINL
jgi:hypothetical protein